MDNYRMLQAAINKSGFKQYWFVWALCLILATIDLFSRVVTFLPRDNVGYKVTAQEGLIIPVLSGDTLERYRLKLSNQFKAAAVDSVELVTTEASVNEGFWVDSGYSYQLLAVFRASSEVAIISRVKIESNEQDILDLEVGDMLGNFVVSRVTGNGIVLEGYDGVRADLLLFKPSPDEMDEDGFSGGE